MCPARRKARLTTTRPRKTDWSYAATGTKSATEAWHQEQLHHRLRNAGSPDGCTSTFCEAVRAPLDEHPEKDAAAAVRPSSMPRNNQG